MDKDPQRNSFKCDVPRTINKTVQNWEVNLLQCNRNKRVSFYFQVAISPFRSNN